jgi:hypothetical protein
MDNHPTIDILSSPRSDCPNPVLGCIEYCFLANNYVLAAGALTLLQISITSTDNYPDGIDVIIGGKPFKTNTPAGAGEFSWQGSIQDIAASIAAMLNADFYFGCEFSFFSVGGIVGGLSKKEGAFDNFIFNFPVANPPTVSVLGGVTNEVRQNYRLIIEVWKCSQEVRTDKITTRAYQPDPNTAELCFDLAGLVEGCVATTFPGLNASLNINIDSSIDETICLRFGEMYSENDASCDAKTQFFEQTSEIKIINSAFQKDDALKFSPFCWVDSTNDTRFLTNRPDFAEICNESFSWLWYVLDSPLANFIASNPIFTLGAFVTFSYTDGSSDSAAISFVVAPEGNTYIVPTGLAQISTLADPSKNIGSYNVLIGVQITGFVFPVPLSTPVIYKVANDGFCCCHEEFYFLSEPGGFDTILFNCVQEINLDYRYTEFCSYEPCEGDIFEGGKEEADAQAYEIYKTTSRFIDKYENLKWLREFLKSSKRLWRNEGKVYKILMLNEQIELFRKDGFIFIEFEYILSFELNQQKN